MGVTGGVLLAWNPLVVKRVTVHLVNFSISIQILDVANGWEWMLTRVYGPSSPYDCHEFWAELFSNLWELEGSVACEGRF